MKKYIKKFSIIIFLLFFIGTAYLYNQAQVDAVGCQSKNVKGYAWSDNIGWISLSCENDYAIGSGVDYGINLNTSSGVFSGYAWSDNIGWISFQEEDLLGCPSGECVAKVNSTTGDIVIGEPNEGSVVGWAKVLSNGEWISFDGHDGNLYLNDDNFYGWAWGDDVVGWLSFNCGDSCLDSDYKVWLEEGTEDVVDIIFTWMAEDFDYCARTKGNDTVAHWSGNNVDDLGVRFGFRWNTADGSDYDADKYTIEIMHGGSVIFSRERDVFGEEVFYRLTENILTGGESYVWRVKIDDSSWAEKIFSVPSTPHPFADFSYSPQENITLGERVLFQSSSEVYSGEIGHQWTFANATPSSSNLSSVEVYFNKDGENEVTLEVSDGEGRTCTRSETINAEFTPPQWQEIHPR